MIENRKTAFEDEIEKVVKTQDEGIFNKHKIVDEQKKIEQRNILTESLSQTGLPVPQTNYSVFDEENSVFITERAWSLGLSLIKERKQMKKLIEVLQDHITIVKDYVFAYESAQDRQLKTEDRLLSLISLHSNKYNHITRIKPLEASLDLKTTRFQLTNRKYEKFYIDTDESKLTHYLMSIILKNLCPSASIKNAVS